MLALTFLAAVGAPEVGRAIYTAGLPHESLVAATFFRRNTFTMLAAFVAQRHTPDTSLVLLVSGAALL